MSSIIKYRNLNYETDDPLVIGCNARKEILKAAGEDEEHGETEIEKKERMLLEKLDELSHRIEEAESKYKEIEIDSDRLLRETNEQVDDIVSKAKDIGYKKGYDEGKTKADNEGKDYKLKLDVELATRMTELKNERKEFLNNTKDQIIDIFNESFKRVFENEIKYSKDLLNALVIKGLRELTDEKEVRIVLDEEDYKNFDRESFLKQVGDEFNDKVISFSFDKNLEQGSCLIETSVGFIDASLNNLANCISELISENVVDK